MLQVNDNAEQHFTIKPFLKFRHTSMCFIIVPSRLLGSQLIKTMNLINHYI